MATATHYTASISIHRVTLEAGGPSNKPERTVEQDVEKVIVRADTLDKLREKLSKRVELIEE